jgi:hypothetical protein
VEAQAYARLVIGGGGARALVLEGWCLRVQIMGTIEMVDSWRSQALNHVLNEGKFRWSHQGSH